MPRFHFSIAKLMAVMIPVALGLAAFRSASQLWVSIIFNLVVAVLLIATYKAKCASGDRGRLVDGLRSVRLVPPGAQPTGDAVGAAL